MRFAGVSLLPLLFAAVACDVTDVPLPPSSVAVNQCEDSSDCDRSFCQNGACVDDDTLLTSLLVQVTPPATLPGLGGFSFYQVLEGQSMYGGRLNIDLGQVVRVDGHVDLDEEDTCLPSDAPSRTIAVDVSFAPSERVLGIASSIYAASVDSTSEDGHFAVEIPPGDYDVYIRPKEPGCVPPRLLLEQPIAGSLAVNLRPPSKLPVDVYWPSDGLQGWKVALLDEQTGRVISTEPMLYEPVYDEAKAAFHYVAELSYFDVEPPDATPEDAADDADDDDSKEQRLKVLRLTPPVEDPDHPSVFLRLLTPEIEQKGVLPQNVTVEGQTAVRGAAIPVEAMLKITAQRLAGFDSGIFAAFTRTVMVPKSGRFDLSLPPGTYNVEATPVGSSAGCGDSGPTEVAPCLASAATIWEVGLDPLVQGGKVIEFPVATTVRGQARLWLGGFATGATVHLTASLAAIQTDLLSARLGMTEPVPRATSALVRSDGNFSLTADPGLYDLVVQPDPSTRFGWYAWSSVRMPELASLGSITVPAPVVYSGSVGVMTSGETSTRVAVPGALLRAYADADGEPGGAVIQVAETRADDEGNFSLLIPHQFGPAPNRGTDYMEMPRPDMR